MLASGRSVSEIAAELNLSVKTVSTHKARLMQKMNMASQADLIRYALAQKLIDDPEAPR
jgi:DNA-binding NarL/FixJ family response regulator